MNQIAPMSEFRFGRALPQPPREFQVPFLEAGAFICKFILGETGENAVCCGAPTDGRSWCAYHRRIVFHSGKPVGLR